MKKGDIKFSFDEILIKLIPQKKLIKYAPLSPDIIFPKKLNNKIKHKKKDIIYKSSLFTNE